MIRTCSAGAVLAAPLLLLLASVPSQAQQGQLDGSPALFTVMAAINAAGYDADIDSPANSPVRNQVRQYLAQRNIACLPELKAFFASHRQKTPGAELSQYVSFALSIEDPPSFRYRYQQNEIPPDAMALAGLDEILARFYEEADIGTLWTKLQAAYLQAIAGYQGPVTQAVMESNAYLRNPTSGYLGRRFQIYIDLLGAPYQIHTRSYKDDYFVVLTPSPESQSDEIRHAYLHYLLDPLSFKYAGAIFKKRGLTDYAQGAPALEQYYKDDLSLLMTECLIKAVEARLTRGGPAQQQARVDEAMGEGFVATAALYELLAGYEKQDLAMRLYYPELVSGIDLRKEERRLANIHFVSERAAKRVKVTPAERKLDLTPGQKELEQAQALYDAKKFDQAREAYLQVVNRQEDKPLHGMAYYGLAKIAVRQRDPVLAEQLFKKTLESAMDADTRSWALVYLGRLADAQGQREEAASHYQAALKIEGISPEARRAAEQGVKEPFNRK